MIDERRLVTRIYPKTSMLDSQYGKVNYMDWCEREVMRINNDNGAVQFWEDGMKCAVVYR